MSISKEIYGVTLKGETVFKFKLRNSSGVSVDILNYGGIITSFIVPDKAGKFENIVLGYNSLNDYIQDQNYIGAVIGRYANRISEGRFTIDDIEYQLDINNSPNHLHGGYFGFNKKVWQVEKTVNTKGQSLKLKLFSKDGESGYPGNLITTIVYNLTPANELIVTYEASSDRATIVNLTQHSYFNLSGNFETTIFDHELSINADRFLPVDSYMIPTGEQKHVTGSVFDFRIPKSIGRDIESNDEQIIQANGYDHCWVLNNSDIINFAAKLFHPESGRVMEVLTTEPGLQFYSGNFLSNNISDNITQNFKDKHALCLETQHFPDSPNHAEFPSVLIEPGKIYRSKTIFRVGLG